MFMIKESPYTQVRVQAIICLRKQFSTMDKESISEKLVPALKECVSVDPSSLVCVEVIDCLSAIADHLGPAAMMSAILPIMIPILSARSLNMDQFTNCISKVQRLFSSIVEFRTKQIREQEHAAEATQKVRRRRRRRRRYAN